MQNEITNTHAVNTFMRSMDEKYPELIVKIENTILENASNLQTMSSFNVDADDLDRSEQIELLSVVRKYFKRQGFHVSNVIYDEDEGKAPYITIEVKIFS